MPGLPFFPDQASTIAGRVDTLFVFMLGLATFVTMLVSSLISYFAIKYRRRSPDELPEQIVGSNKLEVLWTVIPLGLAMVVFFWSAGLYLDMSRPPPETLDIYVVGKQWMWQFQHPEGQRELDELHVPMGRAIKLTMTSQDVIHSFYVPAFRVKADVLPGRYTTTWFEATRPGTYHLFCAEYCGTDHSRMTGWVIVMEPAEFQSWLGTSAEAPATVGAKLFQQFGCAACHRADGNGPGPSLVGVFGQPVQLQSGETVIADENYIRESILNPNAKIVAGYQPIMPTFQDRLSEEQLMPLIIHIKSLAGQRPESQPTPVSSPTP